MKTNVIRNLLHIVFAVTAFLVLPATAAHAAPEQVPNGFAVEVLADGLDQPKGVTSAHFRAGAGNFGDYVYVAESGLDRVVKVDKGGSGYMPFANVGNFPVGINIYGGPFGQQLYVGNALSGDGIDKVDTAGNTTDFALDGSSVAGLDFGRGPYGDFLYAGVWVAGEVWQVDGAGNANLFATLPADTQSRYLKFSHGGAFGHYLYVTDYQAGDIYRIDVQGNVTLFASTGDTGLEGLDFSSGGAFGKYLYVGSVSSGNMYQVDPQGSVTLWAQGFSGVADIHFEPGGPGGFIMYMVNGCLVQDGSCGKVYKIYKENKSQ